ncbi:hypothetical protein BXT86_05435 [candidate division WOR-3 bacterium 4484_100]|uniref:EamA domain-containing protein n=1 Tax=candidate division WOR-3 bacterium 4484_100 TaxID=1936077 RepID=A0A1V4QE56_UNCW3|nr:MAG: hypothetical protein BXT86_05435 [candidate division WOR-3 bacterium 4484_100]
MNHIDAIRMRNKQCSNLKGFLYASGGLLLVSTNFLTAKYGLKGFNPETFSAVWTSAAALYAFFIILLSGHSKQLRLPKGAILKTFFLGLATGIGMILGWSGLALLDPSFASFLWRFSPVMTVVLSTVFLGERLKPRELVGFGIMVFGGVISSVGQWQVVGAGIVLTLLACGAVSIQMLFAKEKITQVHPNILVFYRVGIAALFIIIWTLIRRKFDINVGTSYWLITLLGAFLGPCASFLLTFRSYRYWDLSCSSIVLTAQPLIVLPMAALVFGNIPAGRELLGGLLILAGAFWLALSQHRPISGYH